MRLFAALFCLLALPAAAETLPCGGDTACTLPGGSYRMQAPPDWDGSPLPVLLFYHGHRSSGASVTGGSLAQAFGAAGYLVVAPDGAERADGVRAWPARPEAAPLRDDLAFTFAVLEDVASKAPIDPDRITIAGFSAGGSMAWRVGCLAGGRITHVISLAGALRRPVPEACDSAVSALHIHGYSDGVVPLEGRGIRDWHQGDVFETLDLARTAAGCQTKPAAIEVEGRFWCRDWRGCGSGEVISFCLHPGGHGLPQGWTALALDWLETRRTVRVE